MSIPFLTKQQVHARNLVAPNPVSTPLQLSPLTCQTSAYYTTQTELLGYQAMYAIDQLQAFSEYWQGYVVAGEFNIHTQVFKPKLEVSQGTVFVLHGYLEHSGIYQPLIKEILQQGFSVVMFDLAGHGLSSGDIANIQDFEHYQTILTSVATTMATWSHIAPHPWLAIGHSTGSGILIHHILKQAQQRKSPLFQRALLMSPLIRPAKTAWWHNSVGLGIVKRVKQRVKRPFRHNNHNPQFLRFVRLEDPLQAQSIGMEWVLAVAHWIDKIERYPSCRIPVWVVQGALDQTVDWRYNIQFIRKKFRLQNCVMLEEAAHHLVNEKPDIRLLLTATIPAFLHAKQTQTTYYQ